MCSPSNNTKFCILLQEHQLNHFSPYYKSNQSTISSHTHSTSPVQWHSPSRWKTLLMTSPAQGSRSTHIHCGSTERIQTADCHYFCNNQMEALIGILHSYCPIMLMKTSLMTKNCWLAAQKVMLPWLNQSMITTWNTSAASQYWELINSRQPNVGQLQPSLAYQPTNQSTTLLHIVIWSRVLSSQLETLHDHMYHVLHGTCHTLQIRSQPCQ